MEWIAAEAIHAEVFNDFVQFGRAPVISQDKNIPQIKQRGKVSSSVIFSVIIGIELLDELFQLLHKEEIFIF